HRISSRLSGMDFLEVGAVVVASGGCSARQGQDATGLVHHSRGLNSNPPGICCTLILALAVAGRNEAAVWILEFPIAGGAKSMQRAAVRARQLSRP
ncbi:MAG TPA: hypothetical protein VED59_09720, partial [Acidimicrobiales bacterium]|nr:hypothetical protein [Acidimicrobiales bacterium]